jgi:branched-chain amino acid transport system substrate-binding protein
VGADQNRCSATFHDSREATRKKDQHHCPLIAVNAMKGMAWESPRGPISIDPQTRDIVQNIYIRRVEKVNGELYNTEFMSYNAMKDPEKQ